MIKLNSSFKVSLFKLTYVDARRCIRISLTPSTADNEPASRSSYDDDERHGSKCIWNAAFAATQ